MKNGKVFYGWWIVLGAALVLAVTGPAGVAIANIYQPSVTEALGISNSMFSISNTIILGFSVLFSSIVSSWLSKNFKKVFLISSIIYAAAYAGFGLVSNVWLFYFLSIFVGYGFLATSALAMSILVTNWFVDKRGLALSLSLSGLGIGGIIWSPIVTLMINNFGWRQSYMIYGVVMLIICLLVGSFIFVAKPEDKGMTALGQDAEMNGSDHDSAKNMRVPFTLSEALRKPFFIAMLIGAVLVGLSNNGGLGQFPPFMQNLHGAQQGALIISVYSGVGILGKILLGIVSDKFGTITATIWSSLAIAGAYFIAATTTSYSFAILLAILFGLGNANGTVLTPLFTSAIFAPRNYAKVYGLMNQFIFLGMTFGSLLAATIAEGASYSTAWFVFTGISLLIMVFWIGAYVLAKKDFTIIKK